MINIFSDTYKPRRIIDELKKIWARQDAWVKRQGLPELSEPEAEELIKQAEEEVKAERLKKASRAQIKAGN